MMLICPDCLVSEDYHRDEEGEWLTCAEARQLEHGEGNLHAVMRRVWGER